MLISMKRILRLVTPKTLAALLAAAAFAQSTPAWAVPYVYTGAIATTDPTYNWPLNTTSLSSVGTAVYYDVQPFTVTISGSVTLAVDSATFTPTPADDSYLGFTRIPSTLPLR